MITIGYLDEANNPRYTFNRVFKQDFNVKMLDNPARQFYLVYQELP